MSSECPFCGSHAIGTLNAAVSGVSGFRCQACRKIFYVASVEVTRRIEDAQKKYGPEESVRRSSHRMNQ